METKEIWGQRNQGKLFFQPKLEAIVISLTGNLFTCVSVVPNTPATSYVRTWLSQRD